MTPFNKAGIETLLAPDATVPGLAHIVVEHYGATGSLFLWEQQLLNQGGSNRK